jgi:hypothetical protein
LVFIEAGTWLGWGSNKEVQTNIKILGNILESPFIPFVSFGGLDNNTFKGLTSSLSVEHEIQYDEHI